MQKTNTKKLEKYQLLITSIPCFSMLTPEESLELFHLMVEERYLPKEAIVVENEIIDRVYIIVNGQAEVTQTYQKKTRLRRKKMMQVPLAILRAGESIGLNDTGFFSTTGKRTATVTALTNVTVLMLELNRLHDFLNQHPHLHKAMLAQTNQLLRMHLIKQSLPFVKLSIERAHWLASKVKEVKIPSGEIIFKEGDSGDSCYLIQSGQVEIIDKTEKRLALLKSPTLFGEATLITHDKRNATARTVGETTILVLEHKHLSELLETESNVANMFMTLMVDRSRPLQNAHVTVHPRKTADNQTILILKNPDNGSYFKLSEEGGFIWQQLNGQQTMQAITLSLAAEYNIFSPDRVAALISKLAKAGFVTNVEINSPAIQKNQPFWLRCMLRIKNFLELRFAFGDADKWLSKVYNQAIHLLFSRVSKILLSVIAIAGFITFLYMTNDTIETFQLMPDVWILLVLLIPATLLSVALHELGHAFVTKYYGHEVHYMGVGWFWFGPIAFTDTSDMWLNPKKLPRVMVNLAGIYTDIIIAGICALIMLLISNPYIMAFLWLFALYTYINAFRMLSPLQELDGYYVLMDLLDKPHLRQAAVIWLVKKLPHARQDPDVFKKHKPEIYYWLACLLFLILISLLTLGLQTILLKIIGIQPSNPYLGLAIPFIAVIISSLGILADLRNQSD